MIRALIIFHIWSLVIAVVAWVLQKDSRKNIGDSFPQPAIWLGLIFICIALFTASLIPDSSSISWVASGGFISEIIPDQAEIKTTKLSFNLLWFYFGIAGMFTTQTLWRWLKIQRLSVSSTTQANLFTTEENIPPLTRSWPKRGIIIPASLETETSLIAHEQAHMRFCDAEMTLLLLIIRDLSLRLPGISYLISQWRHAIELRADESATQNMSRQEREDYARLLLERLKPSKFQSGGKALPCPTAHLTSTRYRSVKMRLRRIIETKPKPHKMRWKVGIIAALTSTMGVGYLAGPVQAADQSDFKYVTKIPPQMPSGCKGLDLNSITITGKTIMIEGVETYLHLMEVGHVKASYDIQKDGSLDNISITESNHECFNDKALTALSQWQAEPQTSVRKNVQVRMTFQVTDEGHAELDKVLNQILN